MNVLINKFNLNCHKLRFHPQNKTVETHFKTQGLIPIDRKVDLASLSKIYQIACKVAYNICFLFGYCDMIKFSSQRSFARLQRYLAFLNNFQFNKIKINVS